MPRKSFYKQTAKVEENSISTMYEIEKPSRFTKSETTKNIVNLKNKTTWLVWILLAILILILISGVGIASIGWWYWSSFKQTSGEDPLPIIQTVWNKRQSDIFGDREYKSFLLLGLDQSAGVRSESNLTDTILFSKINTKGSLKMTSLPRDLWIDSLKTKVNALYYYGQQSNPGDGITLVSSVITEITGYPVDYYFIITMDTVRSLVDALGGIDVLVANTFEDTEFPREIDLNSKDALILYETIRFEKGKQHMDGVTALKFIRSRHSKDVFEGTDEGREQRQQLLLTSIKQKLMQPETLTDPHILGSLYKVWKTSVKTNMNEIDLLLLINTLRGKQIAIETSLIPIQDASRSGLLYHPQVGPAKQWVYLPVDESWEKLHTWFKEQW